MTPLFNRILAISGAFAVVATIANAQTGGLAPGAGQLQVKVQDDAATRAFSRRVLRPSEIDSFKTALAAARRGDRPGFEAARDQLNDPVVRKLAQWAFTDAQGEQLSFSEADQARRDLAGWPRPARREGLAERSIETSGLAPEAIIAWFAETPPRTPDGAMALTAAYQAAGRTDEAQALIRTTWRKQPFEAEVQKRILARFGPMLTPDDHVQRAALLLQGPQGPALKDILPLLPTEQQALVEARMALRADARNAEALTAALPAGLRADKGLTLERAGYLRRHEQPEAALALAAGLDVVPLTEDAAARQWTERRLLINAALKRQDYRAAYAVAASHGLTSGTDLTEAEFYAGWMALSKLRDAALADTHFARIQQAGTAPITQARALYWRGKARLAQGDKAAAQAFFSQGARYYWTFYGQLSAEQAGSPLRLDPEPAIGAADRDRFEANELVRAAHVLAEAGEKDLFRVFVIAADDNLPTAQDYALLVDLARDRDQELAMRVVRTAAQKGFVLADRGYPLRARPEVATSAEPALIFALTRQESGFDPSVRSPADARGLMQLLPATAQTVARKIGQPFSADMLYDADYNMRLGSSFLGQLVDRFGGSYVMATAGYNAGPNRPGAWVEYCGDPRAPGSDPLDYIECIPFSETRNYVMRVMENVQMYRAKDAGGQVAPTLSADLKRGGSALAGSFAPQP